MQPDQSTGGYNIKEWTHLTLDPEVNNMILLYSIFGDEFKVSSNNFSIILCTCCGSKFTSGLIFLKQLIFLLNQVIIFKLV